MPALKIYFSTKVQKAINNSWIKVLFTKFSYTFLLINRLLNTGKLDKFKVTKIDRWEKNEKSEMLSD